MTGLGLYQQETGLGEDQFIKLGVPQMSGYNTRASSYNQQALSKSKQRLGDFGGVQATPVGQAVMNAPTVGGLAEGLSLGGSGLFGGINKLFGTDIGANRYGYGENGKQMWTGDLSNNPEALSYFKDNGLTLGAGEGPGLFDMGKELFKGIGTDEIGLGLSLYNSYQNNKRAEDILDMDKAKFALGAGELARQQRKDKDFATNINKSGLGTYSSGQ